MESVKHFLKEKLNFCNCASSGVLEILYYTLSFARDMPNSPSSIRKIDFYPLGWGEWFIYFLEDKGIIWHGFNNADFVLNELGERLLQGLENFSEHFLADEYILNNLADKYLQMGLYKVALRRIDEFIVQFPKEEAGYHTKSEILYGLQKYPEALACIETSIKLEDAEEKQDLKLKIIEKIDL